MEVSKKATEDFKDYIAYVVEDSVAYLDKTKQHPTIDLLYLDSMDCPIVDDPNYPELVKSQQHNLAEFKAALPRLGPNSIVLLDDNNFPNGGKPKATKKFLIENGWVCVYEYYQSLWIRK
jgi:endo-1,4-beta-mannosidase